MEGEPQSPVVLVSNAQEHKRRRQTQDNTMDQEELFMSVPPEILKKAATVTKGDVQQDALGSKHTEERVRPVLSSTK